MRVVMPFFLLAALTISVLVAGSTVGIMPDELLEAEAAQARNQRSSALSSPDGPGWAETTGYGHIEDLSMSAIGDENPRDIVVLDLSYDDSWVANVPEFIGGYRVLYISTPKSRACSRTPVIYFQATQKSMEEFLAAPLDLPSLSAALHSLPGVPPKVNMSFSGGAPIDPEEWAEQDRRWNETSLKEGCLGSKPITEE